MPTRTLGTHWLVGGLTACVALTVVVVGMVLVVADGARDASTTTGSWVSGVPTTEADLSQLTDVKRMAAVATPAHDSTVGLLVHRASGTSVATGVVAESGGIVVVLQPMVAQALSVTVVEPDGTRQDAVPVGTDATTGITVLRIADDLPAAQFTDGDPPTGSVVVAMAEQRGTSTRSTPNLRLYAGTVLFAGMPTGTWQGTGFCATGVAAPLSPGDMGSPLVDASGAVVGVLDTVVGTGRQRTSVFLPAELVRDVAAQIVSRGSVDHGTLGLGVSDAPTVAGVGGGARVESVATGGAGAMAGLRDGDVVVEVDGHAVRSVAELATRLYGDPPGTPLRFAVVRDGATITTMVVLTDG
jgi:putative serine protease PepD